LAERTAAARTRRQRLLQLVCLLRIGDAKRVQVLATPDLELGHGLRLLDLHRLRILPPRGQEEVLDLADLLRLRTAREEVQPASTREYAARTRPENLLCADTVMHPVCSSYRPPPTPSGCAQRPRRVAPGAPPPLKPNGAARPALPTTAPHQQRLAPRDGHHPRPPVPAPPPTAHTAGERVCVVVAHHLEPAKTAVRRSDGHTRGRSDSSERRSRERLDREDFGY
jgi:hypothetical protein